MKVKDQVLKQLEDNKGTYFSGSELAAALGVSRNAVWKAIKSLEKSGYRISAVPNKGYCLNMDNDILSSWSIKQHLNHDGLNITVYDTISSTNDVLKEQAAQGAPHGTVIISQEQTAGKGRMGKNFYSPSKTGIYLSILVRPDIPAGESLFLTTSAAVATAKAIEDVSDKKTDIKWVNDIATAVFDSNTDTVNKRSILIAHLLDYFMDYYENFDKKSYVDEYIKRSMLIGRRIYIVNGDDKIPVTAKEIDRDCRLKVEYEDGSEKWLSSGEVSIKIK